MNDNTVELAVVKGQTSGVFTLSQRGMEFRDDVTYEQWIEALKFIKWSRNRLANGLAGCIRFGRDHFGTEKVNEALEQLEFESILVKTAYAIDAIPEDARYENLDGEHYLEIAKANLTPDKQIRWARIASEQGLTATQLKLSISENRVIDKSSDKSQQTGVITIHGIRQQFDVWLRRVGDIDGIKSKMSPEEINDILEEINPIVNLGINLRPTVEIEV